MNTQFLINVFIVCVAFGQLSYGQQEENDPQVSADSQLVCNYILNKYNPDNFQKLSEFNTNHPCEIFLHDCLFNKTLYQIISNLRSDDLGKKKHAQETIACIQQEFKERIAIYAKRKDEKFRDARFWLTGGLGSLGVYFGVMLAGDRSSPSVFITMLCWVGSAGYILASLVKGLQGGMIKTRCEEMEKMSGFLDDLVVN